MGSKLAALEKAYRTLAQRYRADEIPASAALDSVVDRDPQASQPVTKSAPVEILLALELAPSDQASAVGATLSRLAILGGELVTWKLAEDGARSKVTFRLGNPSRGDRFQAEAIAIPGVSLVSPQVLEVLRR